MGVTEAFGQAWGEHQVLSAQVSWDEPSTNRHRALCFLQIAAAHPAARSPGRRERVTASPSVTWRCALTCPGTGSHEGRAAALAQHRAILP